MADQHPITPPPELFKQWEFMPRSVAFEAAYRAGADMELQACCSVLHLHDREYLHPYELLAARRPKPPSLAEQILALIDKIQRNKEMWDIRDLDVVRRALERLQELEGGND